MMSIADDYRFDQQHPLRRRINEKAAQMGIRHDSPERDAMHVAAAEAINLIETRRAAHDEVEAPSLFG